MGQSLIHCTHDISYFWDEILTGAALGIGSGAVVVTWGWAKKVMYEWFWIGDGG